MISQQIGASCQSKLFQFVDIASHNKVYKLYQLVRTWYQELVTASCLTGTEQVVHRRSCYILSTILLQTVNVLEQRGTSCSTTVTLTCCSLVCRKPFHSVNMLLQPVHNLVCIKVQKHLEVVNSLYSRAWPKYIKASYV